MTNDEYWAAVKALGLTPMKPSDGITQMHQDRDGHPRMVEDPDRFTSEQRADLIAALRFSLGFYD